MGDENNTVEQLDFIEGGFYVQVLTVGGYVGWNDNGSGIALGGFHQVSAGVASYTSGGVVISWSGIDWVWGAGGGVAVPTGVPTPVTGAGWINVDGTYTAQVGTGITDWLEAGVYGQTGTQLVPANALNSTSFWNDVIQDVQASSAPPAVKAAILRDLVMARDIPAYRQEVGERYGLIAPQCFSSTTPIQISLTETKSISDIRVGDTVLAFDPAADLGRGALVPRKVVRLYRNTTNEWVKLTWAENGQTKELITTPGHHFLDHMGNFPTIKR